MRKETFLQQLHEYQSRNKAGYPVTMDDVNEMIAENEFVKSIAVKSTKMTDKQIEAILTKSYSAYFGKSFRNTTDKICMHLMDERLKWAEDMVDTATGRPRSFIVNSKGETTSIGLSTKSMKEKVDRVRNPFDHGARRIGRLDEIVEFATEICDNAKQYLLENLHIDFADRIGDKEFREEFVAYYNENRNINLICDEMLGLADSGDKTNKENKTMATATNSNVAKDVATKVIDANKQAALAVAEITIGKAALKTAGKLVKPKLPLFVRGYADTPLFEVVLANLVHIAVEARFKDNVKARKISKAMMTAAAITVSEHFDVDGMIEDFIDSIGMPKGVKLEDIEE